MGQVGKDGKAFGKGKATFPAPDCRVYDGYFYDAKPHGMVTLTNYIGNRFEGEFVGEKLHGRVTKYEKSTSKVFNNWYQGGYTKESAEITNHQDAHYGDGKPIKADEEKPKA